MKIIYNLEEKQLQELHKFYEQEWWTKERTLEDTKKSVENSQIVIAMIDEDNNLIAFVRVLSDFIFKALILDLIVSKEYRGNSFGKVLLSEILNHASLQNVKHFELYCLPEMELFYKDFAFTTVKNLNFMRMEK